MPMRQTIDGKNDIRVLLSGPSDSEDAGLVEGVPLDPPDDHPGWVLSDLWVEHDTVQEKGEKGQLITRKTNPVFYQVWSRPKTKVKKKRKARAPREAKVPADIQSIKDETAAAVTHQPTPEAASKPPRVRKPKKPKKKPRPRTNQNLAQPPEPPPAPTQVEETPPVN